MRDSAETPPPLPGSVNVADRRYFKESISTGALVAGDPIVSHASGKRILAFARPIRDDKTSAIRGVVSVSTRLEPFQHLFAQEQLPPGSIITLIDKNGIVLTRSPEPEKWIGVNVSDVPSIKQMLRAGDGAIEATLLDGVTRLSGFTTFREVPWLVYVGIPSKAALAPSRAHLSRLILLMLVVSGLAIGTASWIARGIARPIKRLARDAAELAAGDLSCRTTVTARGEVGELAASFNAMAHEVELQRRQLSESEMRARATFEQAAVGIAHVAPNGRLLLVNQRLCDITGYTRDALLARSLQDLTHPDDLARERAFAHALLAGQISTSLHAQEMRYLRQDGSIAWIGHTASLVTKNSGEPDYFISVIEDITERKRSEALAVGQNQVLETMARGAPLAETFTILLHIIEAQSPEMLCSVLLLDADGIHLRHGAAPSLPAEYLHAIDGAAIGPQAGSCGTAAFLGKAVIVEDIAVDPRWDDYRALAMPHGLRACWSTPILDASGHVLGTFAIYYRVPGRPTALHLELIQVATHTAAIAISRKQAEAQILKLNAELEQRVIERTMQLEAVNKELEAFSYSVSHDLKAPLRGIDGYSQLLEEDFQEILGDEGLAFVHNIRRGTAQMHELIEDLLTYSRIERRSVELAMLDLPACIEAVVQGYAREIAEQGIVLQMNVPATIVHADRDGLAIVLRNLLENAIKFSRGARPPIIDIDARTEAGKVTLSVSDNGIGFDMKFHDRIFEMFSRLQRAEDYPGTGVGLALVRKAMQRMHGRVWAKSAPAQGATFFLELSA